MGWCEKNSKSHNRNFERIFVIDIKTLNDDVL